MALTQSATTRTMSSSTQAAIRRSRRRLAEQPIRLHKPHGRNRWCGPGAISILTGCSTDDASRLIRTVSGKRSTTGTSARDLGVVLEAFGFGLYRDEDYRHLDTIKRPTLKQWIDKKQIEPWHTFLVDAGCHFQVVQGDLYTDNIVKDLIAFEDMDRGKRRRFGAAWHLYDETTEGIKMPSRIRGRAVVLGSHLKQQAAQTASVSRKVRALARELDVAIDLTDWRDMEHIYLSVSDDFEREHGDPWEDDHIRFSWEEVLAELEQERERRAEVKIAS